MENKDWYNKLNKSQLNPPNWVFSVVWSILYALMINSLMLVWNDKNCFPYCNAVTFFMIHLVFNLIWTTLFFSWKNPLWSLIDIIILIIFTLITFFEFRKYNVYASNLLIPYIIWICFACYLNLYIVINN